MPCDAWLQTNRNAAIASTGAPRSSHSWRRCARGSSPRHIATTGFRNPRPTSDSTRSAVSMPAFTRGKRGPRAVGGCAGLSGDFAAAGGTAASAGDCGLALLADDIAVLDLLLALEAER